jgi:hypothetical protein
MIREAESHTLAEDAALTYEEGLNAQRSRKEDAIESEAGPSIFPDLFAAVIPAPRRVPGAACILSVPKLTKSQQIANLVGTNVHVAQDQL